MSASKVAVKIGEVHIKFGDYIRGDENGIVVIPQEHVDQVIQLAKIVVAKEKKIRNVIKRRKIGYCPKTFNYSHAWEDKDEIFDLHTHASPDLYQRRYTVDSLEKELIESDSFAVFKSHTNSTVPLTLNSKRIFGSIVLNEFQGGLKLPPVASQFIMSQKPFII
ncbi:MAG: DUF6282 family protein [Streptococcus salivarius]